MNFSKFRLAARHLMREKLNTSVHIIGLTLGMSICLLIGLFLHYELTFDGYHQRAAEIYRINSTWTDNNRKDFLFSTPIPLADALRREVTGIGPVSLAHPVWETRSIVEIDPQKKFRQEHMLIVEPSYLDIFSIESVTGNIRDVLRKPYHALLTESTAAKFYGTENPIGKVFRLNNKFDITVGGVIKDIPANSHQPASMLLSYIPDQKFIGASIDQWTQVSGTATYVIIPNGKSLIDLQQHLDRLAERYTRPPASDPGGVRTAFDIQPLGSIHFDARYSGGSEWVPSVNVNWLWFFALIGLSVLVLACINFVNLSTAQAFNRTKEVGVLKAVGAYGLHLILLFLREAWLLATIAGLLSIGVVQIALPYMNEVLNKQIRFELFQSPILLMTLACGILITGLLAGLYPAYIISRFNPSTTLKARGGAIGSHGVPWLKHTLVVTQFTIAAALLISVMIISRQVDFLRSKSLGFDRSNILKADIALASQASVLKAKLERIPQIADISFGTSTPIDGGHWGTVMSTRKDDEEHRQPITMILVDDRYCPMYGLKLLAGRYPEANDSASVSDQLPREQQVIKAVVNEQVVRALGFRSNDEALQQRFWIGMNSGNVEIVGVVGDFNTRSLHEPIKPTLITINFRTLSQVGIKIAQNSDLPKTIAAVEAAWKAVYPEGVFQYSFLDEQIDSFYKSESSLYAIFKVFASLAMLISCLGLWGLSTYSAQQRTKEIGIRKVLGATINDIVLLLSRDLILLVLVAIVFAIPLSYFVVSNWLTNFAFHVPIGWSVFGIASLTSIAIAFVTVTIQSFRAGNTNPTESLKCE